MMARREERAQTGGAGDEAGRTTAFTPEGIGRVKSVMRSGVNADGAQTSLAVATYGYQGYSGQLASVLDGKELSTGYVRDDFGRLQSLTTPNLKASPISFAHDARGNQGPGPRGPGPREVLQAATSAAGSRSPGTAGRD
jgi:hypothetical protein